MGKAKRLKLEKDAQGRFLADSGITLDDFDAAEYMSIEWPKDWAAPDADPGICLSVKLSNKAVNPVTGRAKFDYIPTEDAIHPFELNFVPPLREYGLQTATGFQLYWEKLSFVFDLPNPYEFPRVKVLEADRVLVERFVRQCRRIAGFGLINTNTSLSARFMDGEWDVRLSEPPTDEAFLAASTVFRQLHNKRETASFIHAVNALHKVIKEMPVERQAAIKPVVGAWQAARGKLMNNTIHTLAIMAATNATLEKPISYRDVNPEDLIKKFNYGDSLHFNAEHGLVDLMADKHHEAYYTYAATASILGLSHLYCGFAVLLDRALGGVD